LIGIAKRFGIAFISIAEDQVFNTLSIDQGLGAVLSQNHISQRAPSLSQKVPSSIINGVTVLLV